MESNENNFLFSNLEIENSYSKQRQEAKEKGKEIQLKFTNKETSSEKNARKKEKRKEERLNYRKNKALIYKQLSEEGKFKNKKEKSDFDHKLQTLSMESKYKIYIDLGFCESMDYNELISLASQIGRSYGQNKIKKDLFAFYLFSCNGPIKEIFTKMGAFNWKMHFINESINDYLAKVEITQNTELVYLSPDAEEELLSVNDKGFTYVIGGIVDKKVIKNQTLSKAEELEVKSLRLPLSKYKIDKDKTIYENSALNIDNVISIIHDYLEIGDWMKVFELNLCPRMTNKILK